MGRIFAEEPLFPGDVQRDADQLVERLHELLPLRFGRSREGEILVPVFGHAAGKHPEMVVRTGGHVAQGELFLLRKIHAQRHRIGRPFGGHD